MKSLRTTSGHFVERPYFSEDEIERICHDELKSVNLYPSAPEPTRIERFIEKKFGISPIYRPLQNGILGYTMFDSNGVQEIVVSRRKALEESLSKKDEEEKSSGNSKEELQERREEEKYEDKTVEDKGPNEKEKPS